MKNWEAHEDKIKELGGVFALTENDEIVPCSCCPCAKCKFNSPKERCDKYMFGWLYEEYQKPKIKISSVAKVILENLDRCWEWIAKDKSGYTYIYTKKPIRKDSDAKYINGIDGECVNFSAFDGKLFDFLSWEDEEPTNIKELLKNCEVIE